MFAGLSVSPALAIEAREAVALCMQQGASQCAFASQADGSIRITTRDGQNISCANASAACTMVYQARPVQIAEANPVARARTGR